jgi:uracil-DNA glycosylase family 4
VTSEDRRATLDVIASEVRVCDRCRLHETRTNAVPGKGSPDTEVVFVGEGPGQREDQKGEPFIGAAGGLLEELLGLVGWQRDDVFITNVVKCRPPGNRDPEPDEIAACQPFLRRQLEVLDPALLVTLGRFSLQTFMPGDRISKVHGTERPIDPETGARAATGYAMYHPAAALRQRALKQTMQQDMAAVPDALIRARKSRADDLEPNSDPIPDPILDPDPPISKEEAATVVPTDSSQTSTDAGAPAVPDDQLGLF